MDILYKSAFRKFVKKQTRPFQLVVEDETEKIRNKPDIGETKKGDLAGFRVRKFTFQKKEYLIAYELQSDCIVFYMIGAHENFYRELKRYIKGVGK